LSAYYRRTLDFARGVTVRVEFTSEGREVVDYAVVLLLAVGESTETIRLYDAAHGFNEMHRYTRSGGKEPGTPFHGGTLGDGMRAAIAEIQRRFPTMIEGWEKR
jgi:hypothetical protein